MSTYCYTRTGISVQNVNPKFSALFQVLVHPYAVLQPSKNFSLRIQGLKGLHRDINGDIGAIEAVVSKHIHGGFSASKYSPERPSGRAPNPEFSAPEPLNLNFTP